MSTLIAGIDIGGKDNHICALSDLGEVIASPQRFAHTRSGSEELARWLVDQVIQGEFDRLQIVGESTGLHWFHLFWHLQHTAEFDGLDVELYLANAHAVAKFKPSLCEQEKTDVKDAQAIAEWLRFRKQPHHQLTLDERFLPLQRLTRHRLGRSAATTCASSWSGTAARRLNLARSCAETLPAVPVHFWLSPLPLWQDRGT